MKKNSVRAPQCGKKLATHSWVQANIARMIDERYADFDQIVQTIDFNNLEVVCEAYRKTAEKVIEIGQNVDNAINSAFFTSLPDMIRQIKHCDLRFLTQKWFDEFAPARHAHDATTIFINGMSLDSELSKKANKTHLHSEYLTREQADAKFVSFTDVENMDFTEDIDNWYTTKKETICNDVKASLKKTSIVVSPNFNSELNAREVKINVSSETKDTTVACRINELTFVTLNFQNENFEGALASFKIAIPQLGNHPIVLNFKGDNSVKYYLDWEYNTRERITQACLLEFQLMNDTWYISRKLFPFKHSI